MGRGTEGGGPSADARAWRPDPAGQGERLRELFDAAAALAPEERAAFVAAHTVGRAELRAELEELLRHHARIDGFLAEPGLGRARPTRLGPVMALGLALGAGARVGDYEILSFLGGGGGGQVFRARQLSLARRVALKLVATHALSAGERERFLRGARIAAEIHHPHLVEVFDSGAEEERGLLFYSMRLVEGRSFQELLAVLAASGPPRPEERRTIVQRVAEIARALAALHARGVIHRDVKPANLLVEGASDARPWQGRAVLVDFGLVTELGSGTHSTAMGTLPYAPPELFLEGRVDARADVYGLGLCLYDLVSGTTPGSRTGPARELARLRALVPDVDLDLEAIVQRCIEALPAERYASGAKLAEDLDAWLEGRPVRARRLTRLERARRELRRHPERVLRWGLRGAALGLAIALVIGAPLVLVHLRGEARRAEAAWSAGDLLEYQRTAARLPGQLHGVLLGAEGLPSLAELETSTDPMALVCQEGLQHGAPAALLLAARYLERDGLAARPELARFLAHGLDDEALRPVTVRLCARLFFDHAMESPEELVQAAPFRERLEGLLRAHRLTGADFLYGLSALAGSGDAGTCELLCPILEERARLESPQAREELRVGVRALELIVWRSNRTGELDAILAQDWDARLARLCPAAERAAPGPDYGTNPALEGLGIALALPKSRLGLPPLGELDFSSNRLRAANRAPILSGEHDVAALWSLVLPHRLTVDSPGLVDAGWALAQMGEPITPVELCRDLDAEYGKPISPQRRLELIEEGLRVGRLERAGEHLGWKPDEDTHLGCWFEQRTVPFTTWQAAPQALNAPLLARWEFHGSELIQGGSALRLEERCAPFLPDDPPQGFARLGMGGVSELRFCFRVPPDERRKTLSFRMEYQKGRRSWLPYCGQASVQVGFEDTLTTVTAGDEAFYQTDIRIYPKQVRADGELVVSVRLEEGSTTTFRVYWAEVRGL